MFSNDLQNESLIKKDEANQSQLNYPYDEVSKYAMTQKQLCITAVDKCCVLEFRSTLLRV